MDPKPVRVRYPNGMEEMGIAISDAILETGPIGSNAELWDIILIDGTPRQITGIKNQIHSATALGRPESEGAEMATRLEHRAASR